MSYVYAGEVTTVPPLHRPGFPVIPPLHGHTHMPKAGSTAAKANSAFWAKALGGDVAQDHDTDECLWDAGWKALA